MVYLRTNMKAKTTHPLQHCIVNYLHEDRKIYAQDIQYMSNETKDGAGDIIQW